MEYLPEQDRSAQEAYKDRARRIEAIPGLAKIEAAIDDLRRWTGEFNASMDSETDGAGLRMAPKYDLGAMRDQYPIANAYLMAEAEASKSNPELSAIGCEALERIIYQPDEWEETIKEMERKKKAFVARHLWD